MKDTSFLKENLFSRRGIFDNKRIYEDTISSYNRAIKYKYGLEIDIRMLCDGTIVCFHDEDMERMLHLEGNIEKITYDELCYLAKYQIPTLEDALNVINGNVPVLIQLKGSSKKHAFEIKVSEILDKYDGKFAVESFDIKPLKWFYKNRKNYVIGYMIGWKNSRKDTFFKKYDFVNIKINSYKPMKIKDFKKDKIVIGWRVMTKEELEANEFLYDNLVCDNLLEIIDE